MIDRRRLEASSRVDEQLARLGEQVTAARQVFVSVFQGEIGVARHRGNL